MDYLDIFIVFLIAVLFAYAVYCVRAVLAERIDHETVSNFRRFFFFFLFFFFFFFFLFFFCSSRIFPTVRFMVDNC